MTVVIADSSPLNYLTLIGSIEILHQLYGTIIVPRQVITDAPMPVTSLQELLADIQSRPAWDGPSIAPADGDYPRAHVDWHEGH